MLRQPCGAGPLFSLYRKLASLYRGAIAVAANFMTPVHFRQMENLGRQDVL